MKIEEIVCDLEHAKALAKAEIHIGKTAFVWSGVMIFSDDPSKNKYVLKPRLDAVGFEDYAAPTAEELGNILPNVISAEQIAVENIGPAYLTIDKLSDNKWRVVYKIFTYTKEDCRETGAYFIRKSDTIVNAMCEAILHLIELGHELNIENGG